MRASWSVVVIPKRREWKWSWLETTPNPSIVIHTAVGNQREQMRRVVVDLRAWQGQRIAVRLVDSSSGGWGHLNFDDFRFHDLPPAVEEDAAAWRSIRNPLLQHLVPNTVPESNETAGSIPAASTLAQMFVPRGFSVDLIAAEPDLHQPMAFTFDAKGRLWVAEGYSYPQKRPIGEGLDRILIFSDSDGDGSFDDRQVFTEGLNLVSGMEVGHGGVWVGAAPELLFIPDRDGDDRPDSEPDVLLDGFGFADTHETLNSFLWGPDGWLYGNQGVFNSSRIGKPGAPDAERQSLSAGVWRYHPTRHQFEVFAHGGSNQWGLDFDQEGQLFMTHCRSYWGRGPTTHVMQGGHYWNQVNSVMRPSSHRRRRRTNRTCKTIFSPQHVTDMEKVAPASEDLVRSTVDILMSARCFTLVTTGQANIAITLFTHNLHGHQMNQQSECA